MAIDRVREQHEQWLNWASAAVVVTFFASHWFDGRPWQDIVYEDALLWALSLSFLPWRGVVFCLQFAILSLFLWTVFGDQERVISGPESIKFLEWLGMALWVFYLGLLTLLAFKATKSPTASS